jgi:hypothetical protein
MHRSNNHYKRLIFLKVNFRQDRVKTFLVDLSVDRSSDRNRSDAIEAELQPISKSL